MLYIYIFIIINKKQQSDIKEICANLFAQVHNNLFRFFTVTLKFLTARYLHFYDLNVVIRKIVGNIGCLDNLKVTARYIKYPPKVYYTTNKQNIKI